MSSEYIVCPNCKTKLKKPVQYQVLGDVAQAGGSFFAVGESDSVPCSVCGFRMSKMDIVEGKFDPRVRLGQIVVTGIVVLIVIGFLLSLCSH